MSATAVAGIDLQIMPEDDLVVPDRWELLVDESVKEPDGSVTLENIAVLEGSERYVVGEEMLKRAIELGNRAGLRSAKALLHQQHLIPVEWRGEVLVFTGTVARGRDGRRCVAYLDWDGSRWYLGWFWLGYNFGSSFRAVCCSRK